MTLYKCECSLCHCHTGKEVTYWKKTRLFTQLNKEISWYRSSWFCKRGILDDRYFMYYIWGSQYESDNKPTTHYIDIPTVYKVGFYILMLFEFNT